MVEAKSDLLQLPIESLFIAHSYRLKDDPDPDLIESVRAEGVRLPLIVRPAEPFGYEVVAGRRRFLAAKSAGLTSVPAIVRPLTDGEARELEIAENLGRKSFAPPELARAVLDRTLARLGEEKVRGFLRAEHQGDLLRASAAIYWRIRNQTEGRPEALSALAEQSPIVREVLSLLRGLGLSFGYFVGSVLPALDWPEDVQQAVAEGLPAKAARVVAGIRDEALRQSAIEAARQAVAEGKSAEKAAREARERGFREAQHSALVNRLDRETEGLALPPGWRFPQGEGQQLAALPDTPALLVESLGHPTALDPLLLAGLIERYSRPGEYVGIWWAGTGLALDLALSGGRAAWGTDPLGLRSDLLPEAPWEAAPPPIEGVEGLDLALLLIPPFQARLSEGLCDAPREDDLTRMELADYLALVVSTALHALETLRPGGRLLALSWCGLPVQGALFMALSEQRWQAAGVAVEQAPERRGVEWQVWVRRG